MIMIMIMKYWFSVDHILGKKGILIFSALR